MRRSTLRNTSRKTAGRILRSVDGYLKWAFNPQPELTTRYDRAA